MVGCERKELFKADLAKLRQWDLQVASFNKEVLREASVVLFRWLWDRSSFLQDLCDELGLQLILPGQTAQAKASQQFMLSTSPEFCNFGTGLNSRWGTAWVSLSIFGDELSFAIKGHPVTHRDFIKVVRNKLGGAHYDKLERRQWQQELLDFVEGLKLADQEALNYQMRQLIKVVLAAVDKCGIERKLQDA